MALSGLWSGQGHAKTTSNWATKIETALCEKQAQAYAVLARISDIEDALVNQRTPIDSLDQFKPNVEPIYDSRGRRTNTREQLNRKALENERNQLIKLSLQTIPLYLAPNNYNPTIKITEKLFLNAQNHPEINFMGLLLGPRGNTLKKLQNDSGAKIGIRGKGSVKGGRGMLDSANLDEELHCVITADSQDKVDLAKKLCLEVIDEVLNAPEGQNEHKRNQLKELAIINGTYRESIPVCSICHEQGHRKYQCPNSQLANNFKCNKCGQIGHLEADCKQQNQQQSDVKEDIDDDFDDFMKELAGDEPEDKVVESSQEVTNIQAQQPEQQQLHDKRSYGDYQRDDGYEQGYNKRHQSSSYNNYRGQSYQSYGNKPYGNQPYGNQPYGNQLYENQQYDNQTYGDQSYGANQSYGGHQYREQRYAQQQQLKDTYGGGYSNPPVQVQAYGFSKSPFDNTPKTASSTNVPPPPPKAKLPPPPPPSTAVNKSNKLPPPPPSGGPKKLPPPPPPKKST